MCLAVVHQDPVHVTNNLGVFPKYPEPGYHMNIVPGSLGGLMYPILAISEQQLVDCDTSSYGCNGGLFTEQDVDGICNGGKLGLAHCSHPGTNWYNTGGKLLSAFCWNHDT